MDQKLITVVVVITLERMDIEQKLKLPQRDLFKPVLTHPSDLKKSPHRVDNGPKTNRGGCGDNSGTDGHRAKIETSSDRSFQKGSREHIRSGENMTRWSERSKN